MKITTLHDLTNSPEFNAYISDKLGNSLCLNDPERFDRIQKAAEDGADGSTHQEAIDDQRDFISDNRELLGDEIADRLEKDLDLVENYHSSRGNLNEQIG